MAIDPFSPIDQLGQLLRKKEVSSLELTRFYLDRLTRYGESLGAVVTITRELAESQARAADAEIAKGKWRGPLHGIPFGVKDLLATKGIPTTWGAEPYRNQVFDFDATVVEKLKDAGAVLVAKLAMVELAGGFGYNNPDASFTGPGRTPWNRDFWSGGSSSGPGAAVGAALVPFAIGSETSGSILTPSAFSGVTGFRPTYGLVSRHGAMALCWTLDKIGPMCRSSRDCFHVLRAIAGADRRDVSSIDAKIDWARKHAATKRRIAIVKGTWEKVQAEVRDNFLRDVESLRRGGHTVEEITYPDFPYGPVVGTIVDAEGASALEDILRNGEAKKLRAVNDRIGGFESAATLAVDYLRAMRVRTKIRHALLDVFEKHDFVAAPTRSTVSYPIGKNFEDAWPGVSGGPSIIGSMNLVGAPAISIPNGLGQHGLPTAIQFNAAPMRDHELLDFAIGVEKSIAFGKRPAGFDA